MGAGPVSSSCPLPPSLAAHHRRGPRGLGTPCKLQPSSGLNSSERRGHELFGNRPGEAMCTKPPKPTERQ